MNIWEAAAWGLLGGLCAEGLWLHTRIRSTKRWSWRRPIPQGLAAYFISTTIRVGLGAVVAAAAAGSGQVSGPLAALGLGVAAPLVVEKLAAGVHFTDKTTYDKAIGDENYPPDKGKDEAPASKDTGVISDAS